MPPAPNPRVTCLPIFNRFGESDLSKACASVLMAQKDTPSIRVWIIRLTALPPPPPTPRTLIMQGEPSPPSGRITPSSRLKGFMEGISDEENS
mmetsp:Transcript_17193/g.21741  ORF Transcript_17193/g.21741 Transcript_17193/m.21741 type:complete len:93 (-) Transcript_17193:103-381(-)